MSNGNDNFKILNEADHIKIRPSMYIGSIDESMMSYFHFNLENNKLLNVEYKTINIIHGLTKIINEIIDNSVDEYIRTNGKYANKIHVDMKETFSSFLVTVTDNGRGIPVIKPDGLDEYRPVLSWSRARSGTSFEDNRVTLGANGIGSFATYVFSNEFVGETHDGTNGLIFDKNGTTKVFPSKKNMTKVKFEPDLSHFNKGNVDFNVHAEYIRQRLINLSICYPKIDFYFNDEKLSIININDIANVFDTDIIVKEENFTIIIGSTADVQEFRFHAYINGLHTSKGGAIVDYISSEICSDLQAVLKKKLKIDITPSYIKNNLFIGVYLSKFSNLKFDSQTKEQITNSKSEVSDYFKEFDFASLTKKIIKNENFIKPITDAILQRKQLADKAALDKKQKQIKKIDIVNHIQATHPNPEERILYIAEGMSAMSPLVSTRQSNKIGGYPVRGKILNVTGESYNTILENVTISELLNVIGIELGKPITNLNYGKIVMMTDADVDGISIRAQLINLFYLWGTQLFDEDRIFIIKTPLLSAKKGNDLRLYYSFDEYNADKKNIKGYEETYFKGLGTMPAEVYAECINKPKLIPIKFYNNVDKSYIEMAFGKSADSRKSWLLDNKLSIIP